MVNRMLIYLTFPRVKIMAFAFPCLKHHLAFAFASSQTILLIRLWLLLFLSQISPTTNCITNSQHRTACCGPTTRCPINSPKPKQWSLGLIFTTRVIDSSNLSSFGFSCLYGLQRRIIKANAIYCMLTQHKHTTRRKQSACYSNRKIKKRKTTHRKKIQQKRHINAHTMKQFLATASDLVGKKQQLPVHVNQENRIQEKSQNGFVKRRNDLLSCKNQAGIFLYAKRNSLLIKMPRI